METHTVHIVEYKPWVVIKFNKGKVPFQQLYLEQTYIGRKESIAQTTCLLEVCV